MPCFSGVSFSQGYDYQTLALSPTILPRESMNRDKISDLNGCASVGPDDMMVLCPKARKGLVDLPSSAPVSDIAASSLGHRDSRSIVFSGGWQSNDDLPDRRIIVCNILALMKNTGTSKQSESLKRKLPLMARKTEEHLYRSAATKEEYLDISTLKARLQRMAQGLESLHRSAFRRKKELAKTKEFAKAKELTKENARKKKAAPVSPEKTCSTPEQEHPMRNDGMFACGWRSVADIKDRKLFIASIVDLIQALNPDVNFTTSPNLLTMAGKLEEHLYLSAVSKEEYMDRSTLQSRIQMVSEGLRYYSTHRMKSDQTETESG